MSPALSLKPTSDRKHSVQMRAVLSILRSEPALFQLLSKFLDLETETIFWDEIYKLPMAAEHRIAVSWAYSIWTDQPRPRANYFEGALSMTPDLQFAVLNALAIRWGLKRD